MRGKNNRKENLNYLSKEFKKYDDLSFRFKSSLQMNLKDGDENEELVTSAIITEQLKE